MQRNQRVQNNASYLDDLKMPTKGIIDTNIERAVLGSLTKTPQSTLEIVNKSGMSKSSVENHLHRLVQKKKAIRHKIEDHSRRNGYCFMWSSIR